VSDPEGNEANQIGARWYFNLNVAYELRERSGWPKMELYANVKNLTDRQPPAAVGLGSASVFDLIGRMYKVGMRVEF
jgi:outer membrane receptor protein involved in Fe transport